MILFKYKLFLILVTFLISTLGCKKEYIEEKQKTAIVVGNYNDAKATPIGDTLIGTLITPKVYRVDLNNDGEDDIEFEAIILQGPSTVQKPQSTVKSLHSDIQILGYINSDTIFIYQDTLISGNSPVNVYYRTFHSCYRNSSLDSFYNVNNVFKIIHLSNGDVIETRGQFFSNSSILEATESSSGQVIGQNIDTTFFSAFINKNNCFSFPLNQEKYIGIKFRNTNKLGWIKLNLLDKHKVYLIESALQN